jgi:hypothetical protein
MQRIRSTNPEIRELLEKEEKPQSSAIVILTYSHATMPECFQE